MMSFGIFGKELGRGTGFQVVEVDGPNNVFLLFNHHFVAWRFFHCLISNSSF